LKSQTERETQMSDAPPAGNPPGTYSNRIDLHNITTNQAAAGTGLCASMHMPTGRMCWLPARHRGSCEFAVQPGNRPAPPQIRVPARPGRQ
jgi:hypothetical protein